MTAPTYDMTMKNARMTATRDVVGNGGKVQVQAANDAILAEWVLTNPGGTVTNAVLTLAFTEGTVQGTAAAGGGVTATKARIVDSGDAVRVSGLSVGIGSGAIQLDNTNIAEGQNVTLTTATVTHAPDPS